VFEVVKGRDDRSFDLIIATNLVIKKVGEREIEKEERDCLVS
jgi:hypothetical protein